mgnify:CR=1 FL=1
MPGHFLAGRLGVVGRTGHERTCQGVRDSAVGITFHQTTCGTEGVSYNRHTLAAGGKMGKVLYYSGCETRNGV